MKMKYLYLFAAVITSLCFIVYLCESGPHMMFGQEINMWIVRGAWLILALANVAFYIQARNAEKVYAEGSMS